MDLAKPRNADYSKAPAGSFPLKSSRTLAPSTQDTPDAARLAVVVAGSLPKPVSPGDDRNRPRRPRSRQEAGVLDATRKPFLARKPLYSCIILVSKTRLRPLRCHRRTGRQGKKRRHQTGIRRKKVDTLIFQFQVKTERFRTIHGTKTA